MALTLDALKKYQEKMIAGLGLEAEDALDDKLLTAAIGMSKAGTKYTKDDIRFPNTSMGGSCWTALNEWQLCTNKFGSTKAPQCFQRYRDWKTLCPAEWIANFEEQASSGKYLGVEVPVFEME